MQPFHTSPYSPIAPLPTSAWVLLLFACLGPGSTSGFLLAVLFLVLLTWLGVISRHLFGYGPYAALLRLRKELPWFAPTPVLTHSIANTAELRQTCEREGFRVFEIDGAAIHNWHDLAQALEAELGPMRFPSEPRAKCQSLLYQAIGKAPFRKILIWRQAGATAGNDPGLVVEFTTLWATASRSQWSPFVLLCDVPESAAPDLASPAPMHRPDVSSDVPEASLAGLSQAPAGAWWKPKPGELTG